MYICNKIFIISTKRAITVPAIIAHKFQQFTVVLYMYMLRYIKFMNELHTVIMLWISQTNNHCLLYTSRCV